MLCIIYLNCATQSRKIDLSHMVHGLVAVNDGSHRRRSSVNFGGQDIFGRKYMYEKLTKGLNFT